MRSSPEEEEEEKGEGEEVGSFRTDSVSKSKSQMALKHEIRPCETVQPENKGCSSKQGRTRHWQSALYSCGEGVHQRACAIGKWRLSALLAGRATADYSIGQPMSPE